MALLTLTQEQVDFFAENGFLRLEKVFPAAQVEALSTELDEVIHTFCVPTRGWEGPWRKHYLKGDAEFKAQLVAIHELPYYSAAWARAVLRERLVEAVSDLIGPEVELHHVTLHAKAPEYGTPFPMHQDHPFYAHETGAYIDALVHVDTATEENGCMKFLKGSHKLGALPHILEGAPHLPTDEYRLEDAVSCPADAGDVVLFSIHTVHGSDLNRTPRWRRLVRLGYRNPRNRQVAGQALGRPGLMVYGVRPKVEGVEINPYGVWQKAPARTA
jgi:ectoine hydroxylase-related dioxygenase (phytanoyl-CoA dioxygenase family)